MNKFKILVNYIKNHFINISQDKYLKTGIVSILIFLSFLITYLLSSEERQKELEIIFLDIGQGDSILIKTPFGQNGLIDTGPNYIPAQKVENNLSLLDDKLDFIILTHPDLDHVGGTQNVLDNFKTKNLIVSTENEYQAYKNIDKLNVFSLNKSNLIILDKNLKLEILGPYKNQTGSDNHKSFVNRLIYGNFEFIFTGDADQEAERNIVSQGYFDKFENLESKQNKTIRILKVGHHGSDTSSSEIFLKKLKPEYCVISVGKDNKYKHPASEVLQRLEKYCKNIYRTDQDGSVSFKTDGKNMYIKNTK